MNEKPSITPTLPPAPLQDNIRANWSLDPEVAFLNHGSFGATPIPVLERQADWRAEMEREPVLFYERNIWGYMDTALEKIGAFVDAPAECLGFVTNATEGVHAAVRSTNLGSGDEIISTSHAYDAVANLLRHTAKRLGITVHFIDIELPYDPSQIVASVERIISGRTKLIVIDHISSVSALIFPVARLIKLAKERGVDVCIDGAHAPGMIDLSIRELGPTYYTGNCHKWICAPKGAGFLYVSPEKHDSVHPNTISNFYGRGFHDEFAWQGTRDITPWLCAPSAIEFMAGFGWDRIRAHNHELMCWAREMLAEAWNVEPIARAEDHGSMCTLPLPARACTSDERFAVSRRLHEEYQVEVPIVDVNGRRMVRPSSQVYNTPRDYERLRDAVLGL